MSALHKLYAVACCLLALFVVPAMAQPQGRLVVGTLQSTSFAGSKIGISPVRNFTVYLPPRYAEQGQRFPVLYFLNYFFEDHREPFAGHGAKALLDKAIAQGLIGDVIVVTADFATPAGSSWYVNSPVTGNWEDFMVRELVPHIDATYRTLATRDSRGIAGDGPGAYGAIRFGMRHPEVFGAVYGLQPVASGPNIQPTHSRPNFERMARATSLADLRDDGFSLIFTSIYQAFSPNPNRPPLFFDPPARRVDGRIVVDSDRTEVLNRDSRCRPCSPLMPTISNHCAASSLTGGVRTRWSIMSMARRLFPISSPNMGCRTKPRSMAAVFATGIGANRDVSTPIFYPSSGEPCCSGRL